jgi:hypothetical protein
MKIKRIIPIFLVILFALTLFTGCSNNTNYSKENNMDASFSDALADREVPESAILRDTVGSVSPSAPSSTPQSTSVNPNENININQKLIKRVYLRTETEDFDSLMTNISQKISDLGGYIQSKEAYNGSSYHSNKVRNAEMVIRIPSNRLDEFVSRVSEFSNIISSSETTEDVTLTYADTQGRLEALKVEQERLMELMKKAETMSDLLEIEARLTEIRADLEATASKLRLYDNLVDYSTINLSITEVSRLTPTEELSVWDKITTGFSESMKNIGEGSLNLLIFILSNIPYLIPLAITVFILFIIIWSVKRSSRKKKANKPDSPAPPPEED